MDEVKDGRPCSDCFTAVGREGFRKKITGDEKYQTRVQMFINHHHHGYYMDHVSQNEPELNIKHRYG